ncbi:hypothetical protein Psch_00709 [Pelotomaculum schinkii]|uniref:Uncharacterized protein n=1 Tax=Pelotomaculum schinkii TaxID=78350 RepID=A0A4Y7REE1_9FIRM|nr:hypothetical protein [Pelotomaculum schinkii]TEB07166.1 hypothetical protein Psch_00709 [Pelotomaculum schinkii]
MIAESEKDKIKRILAAINPIKEYLKTGNYLAQSMCILFDADSTAFRKSYAEIDCGGYQVVPLADYQKMGILNNDGFKVAKYGSDFPTKVAYCINLDSNIVSDIYKLFSGKKLVNKHSLLNLLISIKKANVQTSASPYILECTYNKKILEKSIVYQNILYFFLFSRLSLKQLQEDYFKVMPSIEDYLLADDAWDVINSDFNEDLFDRYLVIYCVLCKTYLIKFGSKKSYENKVKELVEFMNNELYCYLEFELVICCLFLKNDPKLSYFFRLMQPDKDNITDVIKNMTWDILHIRNIQTEMAIRSTINNNSNIFYAHSIASHDKGLIDILKANPIKRLILYKGEAYPKYERDFDNICKDLDIKSILFENTFKREQYCLTHQNSYLKSFTCSLENTIENLRENN